MDLIDRDKLDSFKFRSASERMDLSVEYMSGWNDAIDRIEANAPTVDAVPVRHGHWIKQNDGCVRPFWESYICSECRCQSGDTVYCCSCGAKMDGEREEE